jgi:hypothetical protein
VDYFKVDTFVGESLQFNFWREKIGSRKMRLLDVGATVCLFHIKLVQMQTGQIRWEFTSL